MEEAPKKQYLLMVDDLNGALLRKVIPGISMIEIEGMSMTDNAGYQVLVSPIIKAKEDAGS